MQPSITILEQINKAWTPPLDDRWGGLDKTISRKFTALETGNGNTYLLAKQKQDRLLKEMVTLRFVQLDNIGRRLSKHKTGTKAILVNFPKDFFRIRKDILTLFSKSGIVFDFVNLFANQAFIEMEFMGIRDVDEYCDMYRHLLLADYDSLEGYARAILKFKGVEL